MDRILNFVISHCNVAQVFTISNLEHCCLSISRISLNENEKEVCITHDGVLIERLMNIVEILHVNLEASAGVQRAHMGGTSCRKWHADSLQPQMIYLLKQGLHRILAINRLHTSEIAQTGIVLPTYKASIIAASICVTSPHLCPINLNRGQMPPT